MDWPNDIQIKKFNMNRKLTTKGFQKDQNCQISPCILRVIASQVNAQIRIENEQSMVKRQIKGQMIMKFYKYPRKVDERKTPMKPTSIDLDFRSGRNPCFKISKNLHPNLGETMKNSISKMKLHI